MSYMTETTATWEPSQSSSIDHTTTAKRKREDDYYGRASASIERGYPRSKPAYTGDLSFRNHVMRGRNSRSLDRKSYDRKSYDRKSFDRKSFDRKSFDRKSYDRKSFDRKSFDRKSYDRSYANRSGVRRNESWKCQECFAINESNQACCTRCDSKVQEAQRNYRSSSVGAFPRSRSVVRDDCRRRFTDGREREQLRDSREVHDIKPPPKLEWPPSFESSGAAYVFDARSGFFYEAASDFFYDPKTKLYYGNKQRTYFTYVAGEDPPFRPFSNDTSGVNTKKNDAAEEVMNDAVRSVEKLISSTSPTGSAINGTTTSATTASEAGKADEKKIAIRLKKKSLGITASLATKSSSGMGATPTTADVEITRSKIAICLKKKKPGIAAIVATKSSSGMGATPTIPDVEVSNNNVEEVSLAPLIRKRYTANMEMWSERVQEMKREVQLAETPVQPTVTPSPNPEEQKDPTSNLVAPTHGKPVCLLCKRKFANMEKLKQHIELSALHKQNLRKKAAADAKKEPETNYRDRAKERRTMHGSEPSSIHEEDEDLNIVSSLTQARPVTVNETVTPDQALGEANIGNKLLQKLGWKNDGNESGGSQLKQDWQAIEAIARGNQNMGRTNGKGIGSSMEPHRF